MIDDKLLTYLDKNYKRLFPIIFHFGCWLNETNATVVADALRKYYFGDLEMSSKNARNLIDVKTHFKFSIMYIKFINTVIVY